MKKIDTFSTYKPINKITLERLAYIDTIETLNKIIEIQNEIIDILVERR